MNEREKLVHPSMGSMFRYGNGEWSFATRNGGLEHCTYCGSISPAKLFELLATEGVGYSGSDWKYGWPHKFYIDHAGGHAKFYNDHLRALTPDELTPIAERIADLLGVYFVIEETGALKYRSIPGFQTWGRVGGPRMVQVGHPAIAESQRMVLDQGPKVEPGWWRAASE